MDFSYPTHIQEHLKTIREFVREEIYPLEQQFINQRFSEVLPQLQQKREQVKKLELWAPHIPKKYGGMGLSLLDFAFISEELGRSILGHFVFNCQAPDVGNMELLIQHGSEEQQQKFLHPLINGEIRSCFSMTEPNAPGSNPVWMHTTAQKQEQDYIINGRKWFTSSAEGATFAIVMAITNPHEKKHKRASQILVPTDTPGFQLVRNIPVMGETGDGYFSHAEIAYKDCRVPQSNLLGKEGEGFAIAQERLGPGRIHHCMRWIGICERAFEAMCQRAATREIAPGEFLGSKGMIQQWIAENRAAIDAAKLMVLQAAWKIDNQGSYAARNEISTIKFYVANVLQQVVDRAIQAHGALGITDLTPLAWFYRMERAARIYDGPDEVHKESIAKRILKQYTK